MGTGWKQNPTCECPKLFLPTFDKQDSVNNYFKKIFSYIKNVEASHFSLALKQNENLETGINQNFEHMVESDPTPVMIVWNGISTHPAEGPIRAHHSWFGQVLVAVVKACWNNETIL